MASLTHSLTRTLAAAAAGSSPPSSLTGPLWLLLLLRGVDHHDYQVMEKYLKVKKIEAPLDEVKFTWGPHTLAPELTPDDFSLEEGAAINVIVPQEYLSSGADEEDEGEEQEEEAEAAGGGGAQAGGGEEEDSRHEAQDDGDESGMGSRSHGDNSNKP